MQHLFVLQQGSFFVGCKYLLFCFKSLIFLFYLILSCVDEYTHAFQRAREQVRGLSCRTGSATSLVHFLGLYRHKMSQSLSCWLHLTNDEDSSTSAWIMWQTKMPLHIQEGKEKRKRLRYFCLSTLTPNPLFPLCSLPPRFLYVSSWKLNSHIVNAILLVICAVDSQVSQEFTFPHCLPPSLFLLLCGSGARAAKAHCLCQIRSTEDQNEVII